MSRATNTAVEVAAPNISITACMRCLSETRILRRRSSQYLGATYARSQRHLPSRRQPWVMSFDVYDIPQKGKFTDYRFLDYFILLQMLRCLNDDDIPKFYFIVDTRQAR